MSGSGQDLPRPWELLSEREKPDQAAARELLEETGYSCESVEVVGALWASSVAHPKHVAIARGCRPTGAQSLDEYEECVPVELTVPEFRNLLRDSADVVSLDAAYLALDHASLL